MWLPTPQETILEARAELENAVGSVVDTDQWMKDHPPSVVFGPGTGSLAHQTDEYIEIDKIKEAAGIMAGTILDWCGYEK